MTSLDPTNMDGQRFQVQEKIYKVFQLAEIIGKSYTIK